MAREGDVDESKRATLRRFAALGASSPFVGFAKDSDSDAPDALLGYVAATPGAHFSKIRDDLQLGTGETQHHLRRLEREGVVESREDGEYRRYFPADRFSEFEQVALGYLRRETPRGMVVALLRDPAASGTALAEELGVSAPTVSKYASQLEEAGLLSREDGYALRRPETLLLLLVQHADSFGPEAAELAADADDIVTYDP
ncbi:winged helix-turn-helix transcriptional regulator [Halosimplex halophilum]|uniref:winged helix-turn-helix transcriptional regulator n=1 Tax=Halosimplex TaxID=171163 RepID=UPI00107FCBD9|nr:winged helix-turn-helix transcriptional regulator [Halosimplex halophilum]